MSVNHNNQEQDDLNGGMHDSIFINVWGKPGGGDAGRRALALYAYDLGQKSKQAEIDALRAQLAEAETKLAEALVVKAEDQKALLKQVHSAVLTLNVHPDETKERRMMFLCGVHSAAATIGRFAFPNHVEGLQTPPQEKHSNA
jgi:hypothetical protein